MNNMISELLHFVELDEATRERGPEIWRLIEPHVDAIITNFYQRVNEFSMTAPLSGPAVRRLSVKQKQHWRALFDARYDSDYANSVRRAGIQHRDVALSPMWYVLGYMTLKIAFTEVLADAALPPIQKGCLIKALDKFVAMDMAVVLSTYDAFVLD